MCCGCGVAPQGPPGAPGADGRDGVDGEPGTPGRDGPDAPEATAPPKAPVSFFSYYLFLLLVIGFLLRSHVSSEILEKKKLNDKEVKHNTTFKLVRKMAFDCKLFLCLLYSLEKLF